ncbi:outer membrane beta-barrel protein [Candidatus Poribacteria bacterium]
MRARNLSIFVLVCALAFQTCICIADSDQSRNPYLLGGVLSGTIIKDVHVGARMGSYKPDLEELDDLLAQFDVNAPGASTMYNVFARFKDSPQLSYLLEVGYWENDISSPESIIPIDLEATFTQASLSFLYYPDLIQEYVPLYLGIGAGVAHLELNGDTLTLLREVVTKRESTGVSGNFIVGLEYMVLERLMVSVQTNHIFKNFAVDEEDELKFSFDGTVISIGVSGRF